MSTPTTATPHEVTEFESALHTQGFTDKASREALSVASKTNAITTMASVPAWKFGALTVAATFPEKMADLVTDIKGTDATCLADAAAQAKFTAAIRMALSAETAVHQASLTTLGMANQPTTQVVIGGEHGDVLGNKAEIEEGIKMDREVGGYSLPGESMPSYKMIAHHMRAFKCNPPGCCV